MLPRLLGAQKTSPQLRGVGSQSVCGVWGRREHRGRDGGFSDALPAGTPSRTPRIRNPRVFRDSEVARPPLQVTRARTRAVTQDYEPNSGRQGADRPDLQGSGPTRIPPRCGVQSPPHTHVGAVCTHTNSWAGEATPLSREWRRARRRQPSLPFTRRSPSLLTAAPQPQPCKLHRTK